MGGWLLVSGTLLLRFTPSHAPATSGPQYSYPLPRVFSVHGSYSKPSFSDSHLATDQGCGGRC